MKKKKLLAVVVFMAIAILINNILNFVLIKPGLTRVILHELKTGAYDCVVLGTSHGSYGIDAETFSDNFGQKTMNMCIGGEYMQDSYYLLKLAIKNNDLKTVILDIDYQYLVNVPKDSVAANFIYNAYPTSIDKIQYFKEKVLSMEYRAALFPWMDYRDRITSIKDTISTKTGEAYKSYDAGAVEMESCDTYRGDGFIYREKQNDIKQDKLTTIQWDSSAVDKASLDYYKRIVKLCKENNIEVIMTTVPVTKEKINTQIDTYALIHDYIKQMADSQNIKYYDFNMIRDEYFERSIEDYWDYDGHFYGEAAIRFSKVYAQILKRAVEGKSISQMFYD